MSELFREVLNASFSGGVVILAVLVLRLVLKKRRKSTSACCGSWRGCGCWCLSASKAN